MHLANSKVWIYKYIFILLKKKSRRVELLI